MRKFIILFNKLASETSVVVEWVEVAVFYWGVPGACTGPNIGYCA